MLFPEIVLKGVRRGSPSNKDDDERVRFRDGQRRTRLSFSGMALLMAHRSQRPRRPGVHGGKLVVTMEAIHIGT
jgi:hypothetical protein